MLCYTRWNKSFRRSSTHMFFRISPPRNFKKIIVSNSDFFRMASTLPQIPIFEAIKRHDPNSTAVIHSRLGRRFTYGELLKDVSQEKQKLLELLKEEHKEENSEYGHRIAFMVENSYDYVVSLLSIIGAHSLALPLCSTFPVSELQYILNQSQATLLLASSKFQTKAKQAIEACGQSRPRLIEIEKRMGSSTYQKISLKDSLGPEGGLILYTSGTTDRPKGVLLPQSVMAAQSRSLITAWKQDLNDHLLHVLPLHHIHGVINGIIAPLFAGSRIEFLFPFNATAVWERIAAPYLSNPKTLEKITYITAVPTIYSRLLATHQQLSPEIKIAAQQGISPLNLRLNISGSAALPISIKRAWKDLSHGNILLERYGMTEVGMALSCGLANQDRVDGSVGWPLPDVQVRLVDTETNMVINLGEELNEHGKERDGEIQIRGPTIFKEYFQNTEATTSEHVKSDDGLGRWFKTGDIAVRRTIESAGHSDQKWARGPMYFIRGRKSCDIIKSGGEKVSALEVERELLLLPQISEAVVVAVSSGVWGQKIAAIVILKPKYIEERGKLTPLGMREELRSRLASYKIPRLLKIVDQIPRNAMGKINKKLLVRELFEGDVSGDEI